MSFMMNSRSLAGAGSAVLLIGVVFLSLAGESRATKAGQGDAAARQATFEVRHELTVRVPEGAQRLRAWFVFPQEDPMPGDGTAAAQHVHDLQIDAPYPHRVERDSEGSNTNVRFKTSFLAEELALARGVW